MDTSEKPNAENSAKKIIWYIIQFEVMSVILGLVLANITNITNMAFNPAGIFVDEPTFIHTAIAYYMAANILLMPILLGILVRSRGGS